MVWLFSFFKSREKRFKSGLYISVRKPTVADTWGSYEDEGGVSCFNGLGMTRCGPKPASQFLDQHFIFRFNSWRFAFVYCVDHPLINIDSERFYPAVGYAEGKTQTKFTETHDGNLFIHSSISPSDLPNQDADERPQIYSFYLIDSFSPHHRLQPPRSPLDPLLHS